MAGGECAEKTSDPAHADGLVLRLAPGDCPIVDPPGDELAGPPPELFQPECEDDDD